MRSQGPPVRAAPPQGPGATASGPRQPVHRRPVPGGIRHSPLGGKNRGALGGRLSGVLQCDTEERESPPDGPPPQETPQETRPSGILPPGSSRNTIRNVSTPPWVTGHPARPTRSTEEQDRHPETQLLRPPETRPAVRWPGALPAHRDHRKREGGEPTRRAARASPPRPQRMPGALLRHQLWS